MVTPVFQEYFGSSKEQVEETPNENPDDNSVIIDDDENEILLKYKEEK